MQRCLEEIAKVCTVQVLALLPLDVRVKIHAALPPNARERLRTDLSLLLSKATR